MTRQTARKLSELRHGSHSSDARESVSAVAGRSGNLDDENGGPLLLGHRGARPVPRLSVGAGRRTIPPENSLDCFEYALANGCDGFEFDVRITRDRRLVICHNAWVGGYKVSASAFESLCARNGTRLACLEDVLRAFGDRAYLDIEVKVPGGEELIVKAVRHCRPRCGYLLSSFLPEVLRRLHEIDSALPLGYLCDRSRNISLWRRLPIEVFLPHHRLITQTLVDEVQERGRQIFTWTVNSESELHELGEWGVDGLISDDPKLLSDAFPMSSGKAQRRGDGVSRSVKPRSHLD